MNAALRAPDGAPEVGHAAALRAIAHDALVEHLNRGDARHALQQALHAVAARLHCRCALRAGASGGVARWQLGPAEGHSASAPGWVGLPLSRLGRPVGTLGIESDATPAQVATLLDPLLPAFSALLLHDMQAAEGDAGASGLAGMIRAALAGAGTFVWEWHIDTDRLSDIDEGLSQLGYPADGTGRTQEDWNRLIHPEDREANHAAYLRHAAGETSLYEHAYRIQAQDGSWRWYLERGRVVDRHADGRPLRMVGTQTDITERRQNESRVAEATLLLQTIARHVPGVLFQFSMCTGGLSRFGYISARAGAVLGLGAEQLLADAGVFCDIVLAPDRAPLATSIEASRQSLAEWRHEFRVRRADGGVRWIFGASTPQREADGTVAWHGHFEDVTERRELEVARQEAAAAAAANRAKTEFLSRMSHELRTPLNAVLGFAQLLELDRALPLADTQRRRVQLIREAGEHLLVMIGDLLDLTRIESGSMVLQQVVVPLHALALDAMQMVQGSATAAHVQLSLAPVAQPFAALADRTRLRQVLLNLLSNAIKYNRQGGTVDITIATAGRGEVALRVRDSGVGIALEDQAQVFEPFQRGAQEGGRIEGAGIGLSVTRSLVQLMHGRIELQSTPGAGTTFTVVLPAADVLP